MKVLHTSSICSFTDRQDDCSYPRPPPASDASDVEIRRRLIRERAVHCIQSLKVEGARLDLMNTIEIQIPFSPSSTNLLKKPTRNSKALSKVLIVNYINYYYYYPK
jgi:hypothetical protein